MRTNSVLKLSLLYIVVCLTKVARSTNSIKSLLNNQTPIYLDINKKKWNDLYLHSVLLKSDYYEPLGDKAFQSVSEGENLIWEAKTSNELSYLVVRKDNDLKIYQLNIKVRYFKLENGKWTEEVKTMDPSLRKELSKFLNEHKSGSKDDDDDWKFEDDELLFGEDPVNSKKDSDKLGGFEDVPLIDDADDVDSVDEFDLDDDYLPPPPPPEAFSDVRQRLTVPEIPKSADLSTFKSQAKSLEDLCSVDKLAASENQRLRDIISHLESELFRLKHEHEEFRSKVLAVNDLLYRVVDVLNVH